MPDAFSLCASTCHPIESQNFNIRQNVSYGTYFEVKGQNVFKGQTGKWIQNGEKQIFPNSTLLFYTGKASVKTKAKLF